MFTLLVIFWIICGALAHGLIFAYFQRQFPGLAVIELRTSFMLAFIPAFAGPLTLIAAVIFLLCTEEKFKHGILFNPKNR